MKSRKIIFHPVLQTVHGVWIFIYWTANLALLYSQSDTTTLNNVETNSQKDLLQILLALYRDLNDGNMHALDKYPVSYKHLPVAEPDSESVKEILYMCVDEVTMW